MEKCLQHYYMSADKEHTMSTRLMLFLIANFLLAIFVGVNFFTKATSPPVVVGSQNPVVSKSEQRVNQTVVTTPVAPVVAPTAPPVVVKPAPVITQHAPVVIATPPVNPTTVATPVAPVVANPPVVVKPANPIAPTPVTNVATATKSSGVVTPVLSQAEQGVCIVYGPIDVSNKVVLDTLLAKANILGDAQIVSKPVYEIFWNLGQNKAVAADLFGKQKNGGALQAEKFQLKQDKSGDWIVPIAEITADEKNAYSTTKDLGEKANRSNTGGQWQYRVSENVYFYQFSNSAIIPSEVKAVIDKTFALPNAKC